MAKKPSAPTKPKPKEAEPTGRPGKPAKIDFEAEETLAYVHSLAARGMFEKDIALCCGIHSQSYFVTLKKQYPQLEQAIKAGKAEGMAHVTGRLLDEIDSRNATAMFFYLKCNGWRDNAPIEPTGTDGDTGSAGRRVLERIRSTRKR